MDVRKLLMTTTLYICTCLVLTKEQHCDMCRCSVIKSVLRINCSDVRNPSGVTSDISPYKQPYPESYNHYHYKTFEIEFERNNIENIHRISLINVTKLSFAENKISNIDPGTFLRLKSLKILLLQNNQLQTLHAKSFQGLKNLEKLDLSYNFIKDLNIDTFSELTSLKALSISHNHLSILAGRLFSNTQIQSLDLSYNNISRIKQNVFEGMDDLTSLSLSHNKISLIDNFIFASLYSLMNLDISHNNITFMNSSSLVSMRSLKKLLLSHNKLQDFGISTSDISSDIKVLDLSENQLKDLNTLTGSLEQLKELYLQGNQLSSIELDTRSQLKILNISRNHISKFLALSWSKLEVLDLSHNQLTAIPDGVTGAIMPALQWLSLDNNPMHHVEFPSSSVEHVNDSFLNLTWVSISYMENLEQLGASSLTGLDAPCGRCNSSGYSLKNEEFESVTQKCTHDLSIQISHNPHLTQIHQDSFRNVGVCKLDLSFNALSTLNEDLTDWENLQEIDLQGNPWACTCHLQWALDKVVNKIYKTAPHLLHEFRCDTPSELRNTRIVHFYNWTKPALCSKMEQIRVAPSPENNVNITMGSSNAMIGVMIGLAALAALMVIVGIIYQRKHMRLLFRKRNRRFK